VLKDAGATVSYDFEEAVGEGNVPLPSRWPKWLLNALGDDFFSDVVWVDLSGWNVWNDAYEDAGDYHFNDKDAQLLERLPRLRYLNASNSHLTDEGMRSLGTLRNLDELVLSSPYVTDKGLRYLTNMTEIRLIVLHCPNVSNTGVEALSEELPRTHIESCEVLATLDEVEGGGFM
jgi:hypothetical protein